ncbi:hypothetical protein GCM10009096_01010 [Parasphingorhabdus litoris]|uniref:Uncharacterized protein n=1 Tax=Parasphingorhabdus litoris TaxID=394733 RepID=A0ABN1A096_9SPHN|nr:hypothetical protein [Parasphingorhabdus litoris]
MEMNFPHKSLTKTSADTDADADSAHEALIAHAIARQALSPSARAYLARRKGLAAKPNHSSRGPVGDRIKFFAGELPMRSPLVKSARIFEKGNFRPDLLREKSPNDGAQS